MKKNENNDLLLEIVRRNTWNATNEFKNNTLCLVNENITAVELVEKYGADALRLYEVFLGPPEQTTKFDPDGVRATKK
ncbi:10428_t:CDS:1, partial [Entrophospora sp. SA101]